MVDLSNQDYHNLRPTQGPRHDLKEPLKEIQLDFGKLLEYCKVIYVCVCVPYTHYHSYIHTHEVIVLS